MDEAADAPYGVDLRGDELPGGPSAKRKSPCRQLEGAGGVGDLSHAKTEAESPAAPADLNFSNTTKTSEAPPATPEPQSQ